MSIFIGFLGFLGMVVGLGACALEFIARMGNSSGSVGLYSYHIPALILFGGVGMIFFAFILHSASEQMKKEERRHKAFFAALKSLKEGKVEDVIYWRKSKNTPDTDPTQIVVKIAEAMQHHSPQYIKQLPTSQPAIYDTIEPNLQEAYLSYARGLFLKKDYSYAKMWYQMAYEQEPNEESCICLGFCHLKEQNYSNAAQFLKEALTYKRDFNILYNLLLAHRHLNCYRETVEVLKELRENFPEQLATKKKVLMEIPFEHLTEAQS